MTYCWNIALHASRCTFQKWESSRLDDARLPKSYTASVSSRRSGAQRGRTNALAAASPPCYQLARSRTLVMLQLRATYWWACPKVHWQQHRQTPTRRSSRKKSTFVQAAQRSIHSFWKQNSIGTQPWGGAQALRQRVHRWAANEWASHSTAVQNRRLISKYHVDELKNEYGSLVWHCSDHCYTQLVGYCPALYSHLLWKTFFASPDVFRTELTSASVAHVALQEAVPDIVRRSCRWAFRGKFDAVLPPAYCIP